MLIKFVFVIFVSTRDNVFGPVLSRTQGETSGVLELFSGVVFFLDPSREVDRIAYLSVNLRLLYAIRHKILVFIVLFKFIYAYIAYINSWFKIWVNVVFQWIIHNYLPRCGFAVRRRRGYVSECLALLPTSKVLYRCYIFYLVRRPLLRSVEIKYRVE